MAGDLAKAFRLRTKKRGDAWDYRSAQVPTARLNHASPQAVCRDIRLAQLSPRPSKPGFTSPPRGRKVRGNRLFYTK